MYEKLSFCEKHTFFLLTWAFEVELSRRVLIKQIYEQGLETIPSDTVCYPAKMAHGHIQESIGDAFKCEYLLSWCRFLNSKKRGSG